ncbi:cytochrome c3 family protein [Methylomonas rhizoryzae]|uniref:cytochrome c3 family protein n=1 Tax=Methylomonas rhizoryzae TaxID=2608981 RepID=UPI001231BE75|nr:cytochrome c3 family protein [Methylomonas rhizoryzae]
MRDKSARWLLGRAFIFLNLLLFCAGIQATPKLTVSSAVISKKTGSLTVKGQFSLGKGDSMPQDSELQLLHGEGGALGDGSGSSLFSLATDGKSRKQKFSFSVPKQQLADKPCTVTVVGAELSASKKVAGAPKDCGLTPVCKIVTPSLPKGGEFASYTAGQLVNFVGSAKLKNKKAAPLSYEWDFSGGAVGETMERGNGLFYRDGHPDTASANVTFVRDNSYYRARFAATDAAGRRCEAAITVKVGEPPNPPDSVIAMAAASAKTAPLRGSELDGAGDDVVVIPFEQWSMSHDSDIKSIRNAYMPYNPLVTSMNAYAYKKALKPESLGKDAVELRYAAASNPQDPVGRYSINTTSRNYPVTDDNDLLGASIQKTDIWNVATDRSREPGTAAYSIIDGLLDKDGNPVTYAVDESAYRKTPWIMDKYFTFRIPDPADAGKTLSVRGVAPDFDEGAVRAYDNNGVRTLVNDPNNSDHGRYMPGKDQPYQVNQAQAFSGFNPPVWNTATGQFEAGGDEWWKAQQIPITGIDDQGRVNPFNLLRVEAVDNNGTTLAKTDGVLSAGRDFHCRECHGKGGIAAPENPPHTKAACRGSAFGLVSDARRVANNRAPYPACEEKPRLFSVADIGGTPGNLFDEEYAASMNAESLHEFYDGFYMLTSMQHGTINSTSGKVNGDRPMNCMGCHFSPYQADNFGLAWYDGGRNNIDDPAYYPDFSVSMHRFHGELMWNAAKDGIKRKENGMYQRFDWRSGDKQRTANANLNPDTLFPIFDESGKQLPMEENCLKCHGGKREQHYRDRMFTAGVSCYDCHGDMLAMGGAFTKTDGSPGVRDPSSATDTSGQKHDLFRTSWFDQPDCGACHTGLGADAVLKTAFDPLQPAQISRKPDLTDPDQARFAVVPRVQKTLTISATKPYNFVAQTFESFDEPLSIDAAVFREGKDSHGNVACAACHGAAHAIWPNRDPKANDNVTALQLQGHTGTILECNVCHTADAFKIQTDLDGGIYSGNSKEGILGGPHNMHPVNDPFWWQTAGDGSNGGWHNHYAKLTGGKGEDQCAACHGADHKGTRLSKTPVDRVFVNAKASGVKAKVQVKANTPIGCDLCHSLEKSFPSQDHMAVNLGSNTAGQTTTVVSGVAAESGGMGSER